MMMLRVISPCAFLFYYCELENRAEGKNTGVNCTQKNKASTFLLCFEKGRQQNTPISGGAMALLRKHDKINK